MLNVFFMKADAYYMDLIIKLSKMNIDYIHFGGISMAIRSLTIRIDDTMLDKLHVIADYEGRSANSQVLILIRDCVRDFEKEHGEITTKR